MGTTSGAAGHTTRRGPSRQAGLAGAVKRRKNMEVAAMNDRVDLIRYYTLYGLSRSSHLGFLFFIDSQKECGTVLH
jgi:hypothetical protein